jgi:hypothetical protein
VEPAVTGHVAAPAAGRSAAPAGAPAAAAPAPAAPAVFPAVEPASDLYPWVERLRDLVAADPGLHPRPGEDLRAELLPRLRGHRRAELRRAYWSTRRPDPRADLGITARTLYLAGVTGREQTYDFPDEPVMDWLTGPDGALGGHGDGARVEVLRYIPLRRVTFRLTDAAGLPRRVIVKTKSESGLVRASDALTAAHAADRDGRFDVPRPVLLDLPRRLLYLEELPGRPLDTQLDRLGVDVGMRLLGELHRGVHELDVPGVGRWTAADWLAAARSAALQVAVLVPSVGLRLEALGARLAATLPDDGELAFCQGDFVPGQILCAGPPDVAVERWSVLDLDDGHRADPHSEVASLFTALERELPVAPDRAEDARRTYLDAYTAAAGRPLDPDRWRWFRTVAELRYLARRAIKGRAHPGEADVVLDAIDALGRAGASEV